jgi:glucose/arabinose dehydrogenase
MEPRARRLLLSALAILSAQAAWPVPDVHAASGRPFAPGFVETVVADSLDSPVSMAIAPDGRVFVCEQAGALRIVRDGRALERPFWSAPTRAFMEEGLLGVAFDPDFARNRFVYVCYTALEPVRHQRVSRLTAAGDVAVAGSEIAILDLDENQGWMHVGGGLRFGRDGMLYVGTGENGEGELSQSLRSTFGKLLRIARDGSIPADNPYAASTTGRWRAIWARGLRNAFTFDVQPGTGRIFINDVGDTTWEEVNDGVAGANYGWPAFEGPAGGAGTRWPVHAYRHDRGCAITGGAFYGPARPAFPREWVGRYFYSDYCRNEIRWLDPGSPENDHVFGVTGVPGPVDLRVGADGCLWVLTRGNSSPTGGPHSSLGSILRISPSRAR